MKFTHLNRHQRYQIELLLALNKNVKAIAIILNVHRSTVYREIKRGQLKGQYNSLRSHERTLRRRANSAKNQIRKCSDTWKIVRQLLRQEWSPDEISKRLKMAGSTGQWAVSHQAIYNWIARTGNRLFTKLRRYREATLWAAPRRKYPPGRESIRKRDKEALARQVIGHWELDTIRGRTAVDCIVTMVERVSLYVKLSVPLLKHADIVAQAIREGLAKLPAKTLTLDNGSEFAHFEDFGTKAYFADPGCPRQRARNEHTNGLLRQYIPKKANLMKYSAAQIQQIEDRLNHRPRKTLGYRTPHEVLFNLTPTPVAIRT